MQENNKHLKFYEKFNGQTLIIEKIKYKVKYSYSRQVYPYNAIIHKVSLEPVHKNTKLYKRIADYLGDDWSTCLEHSFEMEIAAREILKKRLS